jgi:ABC-type nitrate/sulfonate/bicarbonate transport system substrate-binding protein
MTQLDETTPTLGDAVLPTADDELWWTRCPVPNTFGLAARRGSYRAEFPADGGLRWIALQQSDDPLVHESHFTHTKQRSFRHGGNVPALWARSEGADTRLIGLTWQPALQPVLALPGSGIEGPADLKGRRLLVPVNPHAKIDFWQAVTLRVYEQALASAGLSLDDVELVRVSQDRPFGRRPDPTRPLRGDLSELARQGTLIRLTLLPLVRGEVDAIVNQGHDAVLIALATGARVVFDQGLAADPLDRVNNDLPDAFTVSGRLADEHPEQVARVVARALETHAWAVANRQAAIEVLGRELGISEEVLRAAYGDDPTPGFEVNLAADRIAGLNEQKSFLLRHGFIRRDVDIAQWVDPRPLELARELLKERS